MKYAPHEYQVYAMERIIQQPAVGLFLDMGLGKTVTSLTAVDQLMFDYFDISRVLVIAPLRVAQDTWTREAAKWDHLRHLKIAQVLGDEKHRIAALDQAADVYVINRENVEWLVEYFSTKKPVYKDGRLVGKTAKRAGRPWPFDMCIIDELSSFKSATAGRFKALRRVRPRFKRLVGLTGTPAPNGYIDLWAQVYLLDQGERLGKTIGEYREQYFHAGAQDPRRLIVYSWELNNGAKDCIDDALRDLCVSMRARDWLELPEVLSTTQSIRLPEPQRKAYRRLEREKLLEIDPNVITAETAAAVLGKLHQYAQGAAYVEEDTGYGYERTGAWETLHSAKLDALEDIIEAAAGQPVLCAYWFKHDLERLRKRFPQARVLRGPEDIAAWNRGEVELMLAHPASAGHGLNLQDGGSHIVWFCLPPFNLEVYQQFNARLDRQGQTRPVHIEHLVVEGTVDEQILAVLEGKAEGQNGLIDAVKACLQRAECA